MEKNIIQQEEIKDSNENLSDSNLLIKSKFFSEMNEEETNVWLKKLNLDENVLTEFENIVKNGKDLISIYNNPSIIEKLNLDLHSNNMINSAIEEAMEEQLKINIEIEQGKNIILNIENEPKYELKEIYNYLELLLKKKVFLCPKNNPNEILIPNTLIYKKILLNPNKYCYLSIFNESIFNPKNGIKNNNNNDINLNIKQTPDLNLEKKEKEINKGYNSLFQINKKNPISDFITDYQMPSHNKSNDINNKDFKYQNILLNRDKDKDKLNNNKFNLNPDNNNINANNEPKKLSPSFNIINNTDTNLNKNYFTQRNFNPKTFSKNEINNNDNGEIFSKITNFKIIDRTKNTNNNNNIEKDKNLDNININPKNKTENRYEFVKYQELDIFKNKNIYNNNPQTELNSNNTNNNEINDINNLILKTQTPNIPSMKNNKKEDSDDILKSLREKYSLPNNNNNGKNDIKDKNMDFQKDYKPKTPITEGRRTFNNDNMKFNNIEDNSNDPLENKFLNYNNNRQSKKEDFDKYNFLSKNKDNMFNNNNNEINEQNNGFGNIGKVRTNRPSPGLDFNNFQYKASGYKSSFGQNLEGNGEENEILDENDNI